MRENARVYSSVLAAKTVVQTGALLADEPLESGNVFSRVKGKSVDTGLERLGAIAADEAVIGGGATVVPGVKIWPREKVAHGAVVDADLMWPRFQWS
ncbi:MAG: hypothetical protein GXO73_07275 [Calditrichaeota bacterium]|nr:hypothetical protein [Calditrichota bacterium]